LGLARQGQARQGEVFSLFDWEVFLDNHNIPYVTRGFSLTRGHIGIQCPFCGDDEGNNLGIDIRNARWHCWREPVPGAHSGRSPYRLIQELLGVGRETAILIVKAGENNITAHDRACRDDIARMLGMGQSPMVPVTKLEFTRDYHRLDSSLRARKLYYPYLTDPLPAGRGYTTTQADWLVRHYRLCYATRGPFSYRVVIPVYFDGRLVTWTGRTIGDDELRYRTLSHDPAKAAASGQPLAVLNIKHTLLDYDRLRDGGQTLVITEGVFDAMRVTLLGWYEGIRGTCLFGKAATPEQIELLAEIAPRWRRRVSLLDADTGLSGLRVFPETLYVDQGVLPPGVKDPALLTRELFSSLVSIW